MKDCKVWCDSSEKFYYECKILDNSGEPLRSAWGDDIVKAGMAYMWNDYIDAVAIFVRNNFVTFSNVKSYFDSSKIEKLSSFIDRWKRPVNSMFDLFITDNAFDDYIKKDIETVAEFYEKNRRQKQRKYSFGEKENLFFESIYKLRKNKFKIELDNDQIMDYLYNGKNEIEGYYLFVDYFNKSAYISKLERVYECSNMLNTIFGFEWDLTHLTK